MFQAPKLTSAGRDLYYRNLAGSPLTITTIKMGSGETTQPISAMTDLVETEVTITAAVTDNNGQYVDASGQFSNADLEAGFYWREIGVFAADPDNPDDRTADILYCYQNAYDTADFIPTAAVETVEKNITIPMTVGDASTVSCTLTVSQILATLQDLQDHNNSPDAHGATFVKVSEKGQANGVASLDENGKVTTEQLPAMDYAPEDHADAGETYGLGTTAKYGHVKLSDATNGTTDATGGTAATPKAVKAAFDRAPGVVRSEATPTEQLAGDLWYRPLASDTLPKERVQRRQTDNSYNAVHQETHVDAVLLRDGSTLLGEKLEEMDEALDVLTTLTKTISTIPTQSGTLDYTGAAQSPTWNGFTTDKLEISGDTSGTNVDTYTVTFTPVEGFLWADGTTEGKTATWTIGRATITAIPAQSGTLTYTGAAQSPTWSGNDASKMTTGGTTSATNAGTFTATFTPTGNYKWSDDSTTAKSVTWTIGKAAITAVPTQSGTLTYTGSVLTPTWSGYVASKMTKGGTQTATNAGTYSISFTPTANYKWADGTTTAKTASWSIGKAAGTLTVSPATMTLQIGSTSGAITVTRAGTGAIHAVSSNTSVATVSVSGTTVTVTSVANTVGSATVTVSVAADANHTAPTNKTCAVTADFPSTTLEANTWAKIKAVSDAGQGANYWSVGDTKTIVINGNAGSTTFTNLSVKAFIIGFNHNATKEGNNKIHFQIGKIGSASIALVDSSYGSSVSATGKFSMNSIRTNAGGWNGCQMRKTVLGSHLTPASPGTNTLLAALPADLRAVMKPITKYTDNTGGGSDTASYVTATTEYLPLLSEWEYHGARTYANSKEKNYQAQYAYYAAGNSKVKYKHNGTTTAAYVWTRSPDASRSGYFCLVSTDGTADYNIAYGSCGVAPCFAA